MLRSLVTDAESSPLATPAIAHGVRSATAGPSLGCTFTPLLHFYSRRLTIILRYRSVGHHLILAHAYAVKAYREEFKPTQRGTIGITLNGDMSMPWDNSPESEYSLASFAPSLLVEVPDELPWSKSRAVPQQLPTSWLAPFRTACGRPIVPNRGYQRLPGCAIFISYRCGCFDGLGQPQLTTLLFPQTSRPRSMRSTSPSVRGVSFYVARSLCPDHGLVR